jgi:squalene-hopene/tetraprenyl-beta-curcumene cyclase
MFKASGVSYRSFFGLADKAMQLSEKVRGLLRQFSVEDKVRDYAVKKCEEWVLQHQEISGDWAGIFPPMVNGVVALSLNGFSLTSDQMRRGLAAIERFAIDDEEGFRVQACVSPV